MKPFVIHEGTAAPLNRINIDTDTIIPSREIRHVSKRGLGEGLFAGWRYLSGGREKREINHEFILNRPQYAGASILLAGSNFGCGSSREHAVWALLEYGFRAIIAPSFGSIFYHNAMRNGLLSVRLPEPSINALCVNPSASTLSRITIGLQNTTVSSDTGQSFRFNIEPIYKEMLLQGLDAIEITLKHTELIEEFQLRDRQTRSWAYLRR